MSLAAASATLDVRTLAPRDRHATIFAAFRDLAAGSAIEIVNDHDPKPLYDQFQAELPDSFAWAYVESGPEVWRVNIRKRARSHGDGGCCGVCGGGA